MGTVSDTQIAAGVPASMRAMVLTGYGSIDHLEARSVPVPVARSGEVLVQVRTVAANHRDLFTIAGSPRAPRLPHILGIDPAGVVVATGEGVDAPAPGTRVVVKPAVACGECDRCLAEDEDACASKQTVGVTRPGGFAEYVAVPTRNAIPLPDAVDFAAGTALVHSFPVALHLLSRAGVGPDDIVLVSSAGGAVGSGAVQLARLAGAKVIAAAGGAEKAAVVAAHADLVVDYVETPAFSRPVRAHFPQGATVYVDSAGNPQVWDEAVRALAPHARVVVCGSHAGPIVKLDLTWLFRQRISILGASGSTVADVREIFDLAGRGQVRPPVDSVQSLWAARSAFQRLLARHNHGKVVLDTSLEYSGSHIALGSPTAYNVRADPAVTAPDQLQSAEKGRPIP